MAATAIVDGEVRGAWRVPKSADPECPDCGEEMHVVSESKDGRMRHFSHNPDFSDGHGGGGGGCGGGEGDDHEKWKAWAAERLDDIFGDRSVALPSNEEILAAPVSDKQIRKADACVFFDEWDDQLGRGLAVEVQVEHKDKDKEMVQRDYDRQGIATAWVYPDDFGSNTFTFNEADFRQRAREKTSMPSGPTYSNWMRLKQFFIETPDYVHPYHSEVPATLPLDWVAENTDPTVEQWRSRIGDIPETVFRDETWENLFDPGIDTGAPVEFPLTTSPPGTDSLDQISTDTSVPATLPLDWVAEVTDPTIGEWQSRMGELNQTVFTNQPWESLFDDEKLQDHSTLHPGMSVTLPLDWVAEKTDPSVEEWRSRFGEVHRAVFRAEPWENLFDSESAVEAYTSDPDPQSSNIVPADCVTNHTNPVPMWSVPVTLPLDWVIDETEPTIYECREHLGWVPDRVRVSSREQIQRPGNVFDDVQCHACASYIHHSEAGEQCETCGEPFDLLWNLNSGRISNGAFNQLRARLDEAEH